MSLNFDLTLYIYIISKLMSKVLGIPSPFDENDRVLRTMEHLANTPVFKEVPPWGLYAW